MFWRRIAVMASVVSTVLLAFPLPSQGAPLMPTSPVSKSAIANTDVLQVRYGGWGGWRGGWGGWRGGWHGGRGWGWGAAGVIAGAAVGAAIAAPYYYGGYGGYGGYDPYYAYAAPYPDYGYSYPGYYAGYYRPYWRHAYWP